MTQEEVKIFLEGFAQKKTRTMVIVDFANVEKWKESLKWRVGIRELGNLVKHLSGRQFARRFYYGADYGKNEKSTRLSPWSENVFSKAKMNGFEIISKRVKYIHDANNISGFAKKCDLDVDMAVDVIREVSAYDTLILFSGDGDLMTAVQFVHEVYGKECFVFGARNHVAREVYDAVAAGHVKGVLYAEDFEYRLSYDRRV